MEKKEEKEREIIIRFKKLTNNPGEEFYEVPVSVFCPVAALKDIVIEKWEIPSEIMTLRYNGNDLIDDEKTVFDLKMKNKDIIEIDIHEEEFDPEKAKKCISELALMICTLNDKASQVQIALNENDIDNANNSFQQFADFFDEFSPKVLEKLENLPKPY
ncbi:hypothetical protein GPJ56_004890 [Histomonas meleagridis]|uniref:uncharacterized protein n=1 Tax=Histomonas meleagridis TaxID=135588 RepID=UPI0035593C84|nr:hypothetical protein GPJ56_004890 [Histomonas meleagridis]KAH0803540.1 hypothetical protein GO595_003884 [Histomonas meleagridis]